MSIFSFFRDKRYVKKNLSNFKNEIASGYYVFWGKKRKIELSKSHKKQKHFLKKMFRIFHFKGNGNQTSFTFSEGTEKILLICDNYVVAKFKNCSCEHVLGVAQRLKLYSNYLPIDCCKYLEFDVNNKIFKMERITGVTFSDSNHAFDLAKMFLDRGLSRENRNIIHKNGVISYIQHGDPGLGNIIYKNKDKPFFIDNDNIGFYPALYDCFVIITYMDDGFSSLKSFYDDNIDCLKSKFDLFRIVFDKKIFDYYLSLFVYFRFKAYDDATRYHKHRCFSFLDDSRSKDIYPITDMVFKKLMNKISLPDYEDLYNFLSLKQSEDIDSNETVKNLNNSQGVIILEKI